MHHMVWAPMHEDGPCFSVSRLKSGPPPCSLLIASTFPVPPSLRNGRAATAEDYNFKLKQELQDEEDAKRAAEEAVRQAERDRVAEQKRLEEEAAAAKQELEEQLEMQKEEERYRKDEEVRVPHTAPLGLNLVAGHLAGCSPRKVGSLAHTSRPCIAR